MEWFISNMDVDLFLKTYAANVILGMWDDYWTNMNNYYFYFDKKAWISISGICLQIPVQTLA